MDPFHWDLSHTIETEVCGLYSDRLENTTHTSATEIQNDADANAQPHHHYDIGRLPPSVGNHTSNDRIPDAITNTANRASNDRTTDAIENAAQVPRSRVTYEKGSFVIVQHDSPSSSSDRNIWVAQVVSVLNQRGTGYAEKVKVHWYDRSTTSTDGRDILLAVFHPCYKEQSRKQRKLNRSTRQRLEIPWYDEVHTDTIKLSFPGLTKRNMLPLAVRSRLST